MICWLAGQTLSNSHTDQLSDTSDVVFLESNGFIALQWILEELKKRWSSEEDQDYIYHVLLPQAILTIYANFHDIPLEEATKRLMTTTGESDSNDSERPGGNVDDSAKPAAG